MAINDNNQITMDNLDELEVHLTIVAKNPNTVKSTSAFLGRRDWPTKVISNVNQAIESIAKDKPDIVLLSFNHPQLNVEKFANLLSQTLNMTCVGFCEVDDRASVAKLHSSKLRYKLAGAPSGPTVQRFVRKVLIEKYGLNVTEESTKANKEGTAEKEEEDSDIIFAGGSARYGKTSVVKGEHLETGPIGVEGDENATHLSGVVIQEGIGSLNAGTIVEKGRDHLSGSAEVGEELDSYSGSAIMQSESESESEQEESYYQQDEPETDHSESTTETKSRRKAVSGRLISTKTSSKELRAVEEVEEQEYEKDPTKPIIKKKRLSAVAKAKILDGQRSQTKENLVGKEVKLLSTMSDLLQTVEPHVELGSHPDDPVEWIGILPVVDQELQGYLAIPVRTKPNENSNHILHKIKTSLEEDFLKQGFDPKIEEGFFIHVDPTYFSSIAKGHAQFILQQGINDESELCVSYFSSTAPNQPIKKVNKTMSTIRLDGVSTENPINFKVYLHLNKNKKYFLYLNTGRTLSSKQKSKLKNRGISSFFIKNTEIENFKQYLASSFVKQLIVSLKEELAVNEQGQEKKKEEESA